MMKTQKSPGVNNVPAELIKYGGEAMIDTFMIICQQIRETKTWPEEWTHSFIIMIPKKGNLRCCKTYRTISLISHPSKIMLTDLTAKQNKCYQENKQTSGQKEAQPNKSST